MLNNLYSTKLTDKQVYHILYLSKVKKMLPYQIEELELFPVSRATIKQIVNGKSRKESYEAFMEYKAQHPKLLVKHFKEAYPMSHKSKFSPFASVLSEGFTEEDATPPIITARNGGGGLRDAYYLEKLQEKHLKDKQMQGIS
jgi:hypothetical protein